MRSLFRSLLVLVVMGLVGCGIEIGENDVQKEGTYASKLEQVIEDARRYVSINKRAGDRYVLQDGLYVVVEENQSKLLYFYSVDDLAGLTEQEEEDLLKKVNAAAENGQVYVVYGDNSKDLLDYVSIDDTAYTGLSPSIDASMTVVNTGEQAGDNTAKAIVCEIPTNAASPTQFTIILEAAFVGEDETSINGDRIELVLANSDSDKVYSGIVTELSVDGLTAKVTMDERLEMGKVYIPRSISGSKIYFGSNVVQVYGEEYDLYIESVEEYGNGLITLVMSKEEYGLLVDDFDVIEIVDKSAKYAQNVTIESINANIVKLTCAKVSQTSIEQTLKYKISYGQSPQVVTGELKISGIGGQKKHFNCKC